MASGIGDIVGQIIWTIITDSAKTIWTLIKLFYQLVKTISPFSTSGISAFAITVFIVGGLAYFIAKYVFHVGKSSIILLIFGLIVFIAIAASLI